MPELQTPAEAATEIEALQIQLADARERESQLHGELQHRVRNMLAIIRSVFSRTAGASETVDDMANHFRGRLDSIARYESFGTGARGTLDLEYVVREELQDFSFGDHPYIAIAGPEVSIPLAIAQLIGLALQELVTNSIKFGVLGAPEGRARLAIGWSTAGDVLTLRWEETGVPVLASAPLRRGFGREFIEDALPYQLCAATVFELRPGGVLCTIALPPGSHQVGRDQNVTG